jgi:hypothetical protein
LSFRYCIASGNFTPAKTLPVQSPESFRSYYESNLLPVARELEDMRREMLRMAGWIALCMLGIGPLFWQCP